MKDKWPYILAIALLIGMLFFVDTKNQIVWDWDIQTAQTTNGGQPYDIDLLDGLFERSLDHGYRVRKLPVMPHPFEGLDSAAIDRKLSQTKDFYEHITNPDISQMSVDTSLMIIRQFPWKTDYCLTDNGWDYEFINIIESLADFAKRGGKAVFVDRVQRYYSKMPSFCTIDGRKNYIPYYDDDYVNTNPPYTPIWYQIRDKNQDTLYTKDHGICVTDGKFLVGAFYSYKKANWDGDDVILSPYDYRYEVSSFLYDNENHHYVIDVYFPESGGHLYVTLMGNYFCNFGLTIPGGTEIIETVMSQIDDQPVLRLDYEPYIPSPSQEMTLLSQIHKNKSLSFVWTLLLVMATCLLLRGLMRRQPAVKNAVDELDKTDAIAVREYKFRNSPLLHFLYQCSWLYQGSKHYSELFYINYRKVARLVNETSDLELQTAKYKEIEAAAGKIAAIYGGDSDKLAEELNWMRDLHVSLLAGEVREVKAKEYVRSQKLADITKKKKDI